MSIRFLVTLLIWSSMAAAAIANAAVFVSVEANPSSITADGKSTGQVLVTVLDQSGTPVSDSTEVRLTTSAGDITPAVYTAGGRAIGILTASVIPQIAIVNAIADGASGSAQVEFTSPDYSAGAASGKTIRMTGGSLAYSVDEDTVLATNNVSMEYKGLLIRAASVQVCQTTGQIRAQGKVSVQKGDQTLTADALACDAHGDRFQLADLSDQSSVMTYDFAKLREIGAATPNTNGGAFAPLINSDSRTWIVSSRLVLIPNDKILFFKASIYVGDSKVITMPYYCYSYDRRESILQQIRYTSSDGMLVDFPFYYRVADTGVGSLKLRYAGEGSESGGYYRPRKGLSMGLEQDYSVGGRGQGRLFADSIVDASRAFEMTHHLEFGTALAGGRADFSARFQPSSSYAKNLYTASLSVMGSMRNYNYAISGYFGGSSIRQPNYLDPASTDYISQSSSSIKSVFRPNSPLIAKGIGGLSPSLTIGYGNLWDSSGGVTSPSLYQSLGLSFNRTKNAGANTVLGFGGSMGMTLADSGRTGTSLRLGPTLRKSWMGGTASLSYTMNLQNGTTDSIYGFAKHELGCDMFLGGAGKLSCFSSVFYGLDSKRLNLYSLIRYQATKIWQIRSNYTLYRYAYEFDSHSYSYSTAYLKIGLYRPLGPYEIGLAWSPQGENYGIDKNKRLWLELAGRGF